MCSVTKQQLVGVDSVPEETGWLGWFLPRLGWLQTRLRESECRILARTGQDSSRDKTTKQRFEWSLKTPLEKQLMPSTTSLVWLVRTANTNWVLEHIQASVLTLLPLYQPFCEDQFARVSQCLNNIRRTPLTRTPITRTTQLTRTESQFPWIWTTSNAFAKC